MSVRRRTGRAVRVEKDRGAAMARIIVTDECGHKVLGLVPAASTVQTAADRLPALVGVEAPAWVVDWTDVEAADRRLTTSGASR